MQGHRILKSNYFKYCYFWITRSVKYFFQWKLTNWIWEVSVAMSNPELSFLVTLHLHSGFLTLESDAWQKGQFKTQDSSCPEGSPFPLPTRRDGMGGSADPHPVLTDTPGLPPSVLSCPPNLSHQFIMSDPVTSLLPKHNGREQPAARCLLTSCPLLSLSLSLFY